MHAWISGKQPWALQTGLEGLEAEGLCSGHCPHRGFGRVNGRTHDVKTQCMLM